MENKIYPKFTVLYEQTATIDKIYILVRGSVRLTREHGNKEIKGFISAAAVVGSAEMFGSRTYLATVVADTEIEVISIEKGAMSKLIEESDPIVKLVINGLNEVVGQLLDQV